MSSRYGFALILLAAALPAQAFVPSSGLWWNPAQSGSGFEIDRQGRLMTLTGYSYGADGSPLWYLAAGAYDEPTQTFSGPANTFSGGQCLDCQYSSPTAAPAGEFSVTFSDSEHAVVTFPGGSYPIEHFVYGYANKLDYLMGEWVFTVNGPSAAGAPGGASEWIIFDSYVTNPDGSLMLGDDGTPVLSGHGDGNDLQATARYNATFDEFLVGVGLVTYDATTNAVSDVQIGYILKGDDRSMTGTVYSPTGAVDPTQAAAFRLGY